jgi:hypothetical protein
MLNEPHEEQEAQARSQVARRHPRRQARAGVRTIGWLLVGKMGIAATLLRIVVEGAAIALIWLGIMRLAARRWRGR